MTERSLMEITKIESLYRALDLAGIAGTLQHQELVVGPRPYLSAPNCVDHTRTYEMHIFYLSDLYETIKQPQTSKIDTLYFSILLPFSVCKSVFMDFSLLISGFNLLLPYGSFGVTQEGEPSLRYCLRTDDIYLPGLLLIEVIDSLFFYTERLGYLLEAVALQQKGVPEAISEAEWMLGGAYQGTVSPDGQVPNKLEKIYAGTVVSLNEEGYFTDFHQWQSEMADEIAREEGISVLTPEHWAVLVFLQKYYAENGSMPTLRRFTLTGEITTKDLYRLFSGGPLKKAAKIAGLPKPRGCV